MLTTPHIIYCKNNMVNLLNASTWQRPIQFLNLVVLQVKQS